VHRSGVPKIEYPLSLSCDGAFSTRSNSDFIAMVDGDLGVFRGRSSRPSSYYKLRFFPDKRRKGSRVSTSFKAFLRPRSHFVPQFFATSLRSVSHCPPTKAAQPFFLRFGSSLVSLRQPSRWRMRLHSARTGEYMYYLIAFRSDSVAPIRRRVRRPSFSFMLR